MTQDEIKKLARDCGASKVPDIWGFAYEFSLEEIAAYTAAVEAPLQTKLAELKAELEQLNADYKEKK